MDSLTLDERFNQPSIFSGISVNEHIDYRQVMSLIQNYDLEKCPWLPHYFYQYYSGFDCFLSEWKTKKHNWGRTYPENYLSISVMHRPYRHSLCKNYIDYDIVNCNPSIALFLMKKFNFKYNYLQEYCNNPKQFRNDLSQYYNCSLDEAKKKIIKIINGAYAILDDHPFIIELGNEMKPFIKEINKSNKHIENATKDENWRPNSLLSYFYQSIERFIQESIITMLHTNYNIPLHTIIPCQDGFMILKEYKQDSAIINTFIATLGFDLLVIEKPFDEDLKVSGYDCLPFSIYCGEAESAQLLDIKGGLNPIVSTGDDKFVESYMYNGVYWKSIPIHNAMFFKNSFEKIKLWMVEQQLFFIRAITSRPDYVSTSDKKENNLIEKQRRTDANEMIKHRIKEFNERKKHFMLRQKETKSIIDNKNKSLVKESNIKKKELIKEIKIMKKADDTNANIVIKETELASINIELESFIMQEFDEICPQLNVIEAETTPETDYNDLISTLSKASLSFSNLSSNRCRENIITILLKNKYVEKIEWNKNPDLFTFENSIWDLQKNERIIPKKEQFINISCGYNYDTESKEKVKEIEDLIKSILPFEDVRMFFLRKLRTGLVATQIQYFFISIGGGGNGKSILSDLYAKCLGNYGYKLPSCMMQQNMKSGPNPEMANLKNKRYVYTSEPNAENRFSVSTIKELTAEAEINQRDLYKSNGTVCLVNTTSCDLNVPPKLDIIDGGIERRLRFIPFETTAVSKEIYDLAEDKTLLNIKNSLYTTDLWRSEYKQALFDYLRNIVYTQTFDDVPEKCKVQASAYMAISSDVVTFIEEFYERYDDADPVKLKDIYKIFSTSPTFDALTKQQKRSFNYKTFVNKMETDPTIKSFVKQEKSYYKGKQLNCLSLIGYRLIENEVVGNMIIDLI